MSKTKKLNLGMVFSFIYAILSVALGVFIFAATVTMLDLILYFGILTIVFGAGMIGVSFQEKELGNKLFLEGVLALVIGFLLVFYPGISIHTGMLMIATLLMTLGIFKMFNGFGELRSCKGRQTTFIGLISVIASIVLLSNPALLIETIGVYTIAFGIVLAIMSTMKKK